MKQELKCLFTSDLHGNESKYDRLFRYIEVSPPDALFLGGDLTRSIMNIGGVNHGNNFFSNYIQHNLQNLKDILKELYPEIYIILGNDDSRIYEEEAINIERQG